MTTPAEKALRTAIIRLAYKKPEIRDVLLPILKDAGLIPEGTTIELPKSKTRVFRSRSGLRVWDLAWAGKRGKSVLTFVLYDLDYVRDPAAKKRIEQWINSLDGMTSFRAMLDSVKDLNDRVPGNHLEMKVVKGVDVAPFGFGPIEINGKNVSIESGWDTFVIRDLTDTYNEPTCIPAIKGGKRSIKKFYRWVNDNERALISMTFSQVMDEMRSEGIKYHYYCAMD